MKNTEDESHLDEFVPFRDIGRLADESSELLDCRLIGTDGGIVIPQIVLIARSLRRNFEG